MIKLVKSMCDQIADHLRDDIFCGRFAEGERLSEAPLAERFGVSRGPVRDALLQLTHEGLLMAKPNCGVTVAPAASDAIRQLIMPIRRMVETYALRTVFGDLGEQDFQNWEEILTRMEIACRQKDLASILRTDMAFHRALVTRAAQHDLIRIWGLLIGRVRNHFWNIIDRYEDVNEIARDHRALLETFRAGDVERAVKALDEHIW